MSETLGQRICQRRRMLSLSQEAFGEKMGVSRQAISKWESDAAIPEVERLMEMSKHFGVSVGWLLGMENDETKQEPTTPDHIVIRMPEPIPVEPDIQPVDSPPEPPSKNWRWPLVAGVMTVSLILSSVGLARTFNHSTDNRQALMAIQANQNKRIVQLEGELETLRTQLSGSIDGLSSDVEDLEYTYQWLEAELSRIRNRLPEVTPPEQTDDPSTPGVGSLESWSLTGKADAALSTVTLTFTGTTVSDAESASLIAVKRDDTNQQVATVTCDKVDRSYQGTLQVPVANGYQYVLMLEYPDGTVERIVLTGHNLEDLTVGTKAQVLADAMEQSGLGFHTNQKFWIGWDRITLTPPQLSSPESDVEWKDLKLCYYHRGQLVTEVPLEEHLAGVDLEMNMLDFRLPVQTFTMPSFMHGDKLQLTLDGTICIDGEQTTFSTTLIRWFVDAQTLVEYSA